MTGRRPTTTPACFHPRCSTTPASGFSRAAGDGRLVGGAITHAGPGTVGLSNVWGAEGVAVFDEVLVAVSALHPGLAVTDYAWGDDRDAMVAAGFTPVGPQRVWSR